MQYRTRRSMCRLGFLSMCVLPTVFVGIWIVWPKSTTQWERRLSHQIGLEVHLGEVSYPRPGVTRLHDVRLVDPETGGVAHAARVEITRNEQGLFVEVPNAELQLTQLARIQQVLDQRILRQRTVGPTSLSLRTKHLSFTAARDEDEFSLSGLTDLQCRVARTHEGSRMTISFRCPDRQHDRPAEFVVQRMSEGGMAPKTRWFLETNGCALPCSLLRAQLPAVRSLGAECQFDGLIWAEQGDHTWNADAEGILTRVDLDRLVSQRFPHILRGFSTVQFKRVQIRNGRLMAAAGTAHSLGGQVSNTLLAAAGHHLQLRQPAVAALPLIHYRQLHVGFLVEEGSLSLRGHCDSEGTLLTDGSGKPLLLEAYNPVVGIWALVRTLVPSSQVHVPFTKETTMLLSTFPLPSAADIR